jgi:hypothetical protein
MIGAEEHLESYEYRKKRQWIEFVAKILSSPQSETNQIKDLSIDVNWIYGIRCVDVVDCFKHYVE